MDLTQVEQNQYGDVFFSNVNELSFRQQSAQVLFEQYIIPKIVNDDALYIIVGTDSGLLANYIEKKFSTDRKGRRFLFIELPDVLASFGALSFPEWIKVIDDTSQIHSLLENEYLNSTVNNNIISIQSISHIDGISDYIKLGKVVADFIANNFYDRYTKLNAIVFIRPVVYNIPYNINSVKDKENSLLGCHAVIVGGGPSLDDAIEWIVNNQENLIVFAVARVASRLALAGIKVHFFVTIDPSTESFSNSKDMLKTAYNTVLINLNHGNTSLVSQWQGKRLYLRSRYPWQEIESNEPIEYMGNTVTHFAVASAIILGAKSIYLAGVDMCYKGSQTHASGSAENELGKYYITQRPQVMTYNDELADTTVIFEEGRNYLQAQVNYCSASGKQISFYNLSRYAAKVEGIELYTGESIVVEKDSMSLSYDNLLNSLVLTKTLSQKHSEQSIKEIQSDRKYFLALKKIADDGLGLSKKITESSLEIYRKLDKIEKKMFALLSQSQAHKAFIGKIGHHEFEKFELVNMAFKHKDMTNLTADELKTFNVARYTAFSISISLATELMDEALVHLAWHKNMLLGKLSLSALAERWLSTNEPGLIYQWLSYFPEAENDSNNTAIIDKLKQAYQQLLNEEQGKHIENLRAQSENIPYLLSEVERAIAHDNRDELTQLHEAFVKALEDESDKVMVSPLFEGLSYLISGNQEQALVLLSELSFNDFWIAKFTLTEVLKLALVLEKHDIVVHCYEELCIINPQVLPSFAGYWLAMSQPEKAQSTLEFYLLENNDNLEAKVRLLRVYLMLNKKEKAKELLVLLTIKLPDNEEVNQLANELAQLDGV